MPYSKLRSLYVGLPALGLLGLLVASCGSSNGGSSGDAGDDISHKLPEVIVGDGAADDAGDDGSPSTGFSDGTTGQPCTKDSDCAAPGGPGTNLCSNNPIFTVLVANVKVNLLPSPVCLVPPGPGNTPNCDPAPPGGQPGGLYTCDGPNSICMPLSPAAPVTNQGICQIFCQAAFDGSPAIGCMGQDTCVFVYSSTDPTTNAPIQLGFCQGACEKDADCAGLNNAQAADAGPPWVCQTDVGFCTQHPVTRTKSIGTACTSTGRGDDNTTGACYCPLGNKLGQGFCTQACLVGGSVPCPNGWECDDQQASHDFNDAAVTTETRYTPGLCVPKCTLGAEAGAPMPEASTPEASVPSDASSEASDEASAPEGGSSGGDAASSADSGQGSSSGCPVNSTCQVLSPNGPECQP